MTNNMVSMNCQPMSHVFEKAVSIILQELDSEPNNLLGEVNPVSRPSKGKAHS